MCRTGVEDTNHLYFVCSTLLKYGIVFLIGWVLFFFTTILLVYTLQALILWVLTKRKTGF